MSRDSEGKTPAHWAATTQNVALMQQLVLAFSLHPFAKASRDDPSLRVCHIMNVPDNQGRTPLHVAVGIGNSAITELILSVDQAKVDLDPRGNVKASVDDYRTSEPRIFACGDMRRGQSLVVWAIREGRQAAQAVDAYLMGASKLPR